MQVNGQTNGQWNRTKATFFLGDLEQDWENANGTWSVAETRLTISGPGGAIGVCTIAGDHVQGQPTREWYHKDHLGSVAFVTDEAGNVSGYDAWGHRRDPQTRERTSIGYTPLAGYTGHDMLDNLGIVHMGGRLYDPLLGRTLSPDPLIRNPSFSESYNRYSYVENRPLSATDPTGYAVNMSIDWLASPDLGIGKDYSGMFAPGPGSWNPGLITYVPVYNSPPFDFTSTGTGTVSPVKSTSATVSVPKPIVVEQASRSALQAPKGVGLRQVRQVSLPDVMRPAQTSNIGTPPSASSSLVALAARSLGWGLLLLTPNSMGSGDVPAYNLPPLRRRNVKIESEADSVAWDNYNSRFRSDPGAAEREYADYLANRNIEFSYDIFGQGPWTPYVVRYDPNFPGRPDPKWSLDTRDFQEGILTQNGGLRNRSEFWRMWASHRPETLSNANLYLIQELDLSPKVDDTWIRFFPGA